MSNKTKSLRKEIQKINSLAPESRANAVAALAEFIAQRLLYNAYINQIETSETQDPASYDTDEDVIGSYVSDMGEEISSKIRELVFEKHQSFTFRSFVEDHVFQPGDKLEQTRGIVQHAEVVEVTDTGRIRLQFFFEGESLEAMLVNKKFIAAMIAGGTWRLTPAVMEQKESQPAKKDTIIGKIEPNTQVIFKLHDNVLRILYQNPDKTWSCEISYGSGNGKWCKRDYTEDQILGFEDGWKIRSVIKTKSIEHPIWAACRVEPGILYETTDRDMMLVVQNIGSDEYDIIRWPSDPTVKHGHLSDAFEDGIMSWIRSREIRSVVILDHEELRQVALSSNLRPYSV